MNFKDLAKEVYEQACICETCSDTEWDDEVLRLYNKISDLHSLAKQDFKERKEAISGGHNFSKIANKYEGDTSL